MGIPDISDLTLEQLSELSAHISLVYERGRAEEVVDREQRVSDVKAAIQALENLLGSYDNPANLESIRGILQFSDAQMAENSGLAIRLAFTGMEHLTQTVLDLAHIISK